jgi:hypothetical protein
MRESSPPFSSPSSSSIAASFSSASLASLACGCRFSRRFLAQPDLPWPYTHKR